MKTQPVIGAVPIKPFGAAKQRLAEVLPVGARENASRLMASRTLCALATAGASPLVLAADDAVAAWAESAGWSVVTERGSTLDGAARVAVEMAAGSQSAWLICHADLPLISAAVLALALEALSRDKMVIAPSSDGGTSLLGGIDPAFEFTYGPGSFHRHLHQAARHQPVVLTSPELMIDLDQPNDLVAVHRRAPWLAAAIDTLSGA